MALVWLVAAVMKTLSFDEFRPVIGAFLPSFGSVDTAIAATVIVAEALIAILLFTRHRLVGAWLSAILASAFLGANFLRILEGVHAPCACFGILYTLTPVAMIAIDAALIAASLYLTLANDPWRKK